MFLQLFLYLVDCGLEKFYKDDENMPIVSFTNLELKDIFRMCIGRVSHNLICEKRPYRVKNSATFILNQEKANIEHILDVDSDDLGLKITKSENVRFYELSYGKDKFDTTKPPDYSRKNDRGQVISGTYKERNGNNWEVCEADLNKLVGVMRRRASFSESS